MTKEEAFKWFLKGWNQSGEGFNSEYVGPKVDEEGEIIHLRKIFEKEWNEVTQ